MGMLRMQRVVITFAVLLGICLGLFPAPAQAQSPVVTAGPYQTSFGVRCRDGQCSLAADLGAGEVEVAVPAETPVKFDLPAGNLDFLSGSAVEIGDKLTLTLPIGEIRIPDGEFDVILDEAGAIHQLHGAAASVLPNLALPYNIHIGGNFAAEFGYDFGSELGDVSALLDADQRYFFLRVGDGFTFDTSLADAESRGEPITLAVPENESATLVIDPRSQVLYLDGRFDLSQVLRLATVAAALGIDVQQLPMLTGLVLPLRSTVGVAALLAREPGRNFVEFNGNLGIDGGPLGQLLRLGDEPLRLDSSVRIDRSGIKLQGVVDAKLVPATLLESGGTVEFFVPFGQLHDAYVRIGGELSVPLVGIANEGVAQLGGGTPAGAAEEAEAAANDAGSVWWDTATTWIGSTASGTASGAATGAQASLELLQGVVDVTRGGLGAAAGGASSAAGVVAGGASSAAGAAGSVAGSALSGAATGASCGLSKAQQLWCRTTRLCEVPEDVCGAEGD